MGLFKRLKDWFKKEDEIVDIPQESVDISDPSYCDKECVFCTKVIGMDRYKRVNGKFFHKKCFKQQKSLYMRS